MHPYQGGPPLPSPATVRGIPLGPGERVVYFHHTKNVGMRILMFFMGIGLAVLLIGLLFLWLAFTDQSDTTVITNRRFIRVSGKKPAETMGIRDILRTESVHGLRNRLTEMRLYDAHERCVGVAFTSDEGLKLLVRRILADRTIVDEMPSVTYEP
jgi:hypothetical protein